MLPYLSPPGGDREYPSLANRTEWQTYTKANSTSNSADNNQAGTEGEGEVR